MPLGTSRRDALAFALFWLLPALLLGECLVGGKHYLPYDTAEFPPVADALTRAQREELRAHANYDATEAPIWFAIELQLAREALARGQLPHWNAYVRGGAPMLAHGHLGLMDPLHWPALLFADPADGLLYLTWAMFALAGALMFGLLRALDLSRPAAVFGGVAFAWSGTLSANGHWFMRMEPLALAPGLFWAMLALARRRGRARCLPAAGMALATTGIWMSGFPQFGIPVTLLAGGLGAALCLAARRAGARQAAALAGWFLLGLGTGLLLAMPQLLQMLQFYPLSNRPIDESLDRAARHAFAAPGFLGYLFPALYSHPGDATLPGDASPLPWLWSDLHDWRSGAQLLPNYNFTEYALFPGTLPLLCALLALCTRGPRWRWLCAGGLLAVWLLATGALGASSAYLLPGLKTVPPYRFMGPACALVAMLGALGFERLRQGIDARLLRAAALLLLLAGGACLVLARGEDAPTRADDPWLLQIVARYRDVYARAAGVPAAEITPAMALQTKFTVADREDPAVRHDSLRLGRQRLRANLVRGGVAWLAAALLGALLSLQRARGLRGWPAALALLATAGELLLFALPLNRGQPLPYAHDSPVHRLLREQRDGARAAGGFLVARGAGPYGPWNLPGGTLGKDHIRDLNFYAFVDKQSDLPIRRLYGDAFILRGFVCNALPDDARLELPWWDLMGLRYVLATQPMQHAGRLVLHTRHAGGDGPAREEFVYERPAALPRAFVVPALRVVDDERTLVDLLTAPGLDPRAAALVDGADARALGALPAAAAAAARPVAFVHEDSGNLVLQVGAGAPGYLVVADTFFPGWTAAVDGRPAHLARGNLYQRVVALPPDACEVHFRFRARGYRTGLLLGGLGALALALLAAPGLVGRKRAGAPPPAAAARGPA